MKRDVIVTLANREWINQAKAFFASVYFNSGWDGDYLLLAHTTGKEELDWFWNRGIHVKSVSAMEGRNEKDPKTIHCSKFYLFDKEFKKWERVVYLDADIIVRGCLDGIKKVRKFGAVQGMHGGGTMGFKIDRCKTQWGFPQFLTDDLNRKFDRETPAFNAGVLVFNTQIIENQLILNFRKYLRQYEAYYPGDEDVFNFLFYKKWEKLPQIYNISVHRMLEDGVPPEKIRGLVLHFLMNFRGKRVWDEGHPYYGEWRENLEKARLIDLNKRLPPREIWSQYKIIRYSMDVSWQLKRATLIRRLREKLSRLRAATEPAENAVRTLLGFLTFHLFPKRKVILIVSPMRTGSTLLKALLAEAPDVSSLPEMSINFIFKDNQYLNYWKIFRRSDKGIVVLKKPLSPEFTEYKLGSMIPDKDSIKVIVLCRNVMDTVKSLLRMTKDRSLDPISQGSYKEYSVTDWVQYWCKAYQSILTNKELMERRVTFVKYEELISRPKEVTSRLFQFIGSKQKRGVDTYKHPSTYDWRWGNDDGGSLIRTLRVIRDRPSSSEEEPNQRIGEIVESSNEVAQIQEKLGYFSTSKELKCSVIVVSYRRPTFLLETVAALYPQVRERAEIIVVNQAASEEIKNHFKFFSGVRYFNLPTANMVEARNFGILEAKHDIILFVDDDVKPSPSLIEGHLTAYRDETVGGVAGRIINEGENDRVHVDPHALTHVNSWYYTQFDHLDRVEISTARGCNMSFRKELLLRIGGFDTRFRSFRDDSDLSFRIRALGYRLIFEPTAELVHLDASTGGTRPTEQTANPWKREWLMYRTHFYHYRDNLLFLCKHFKGRGFVKNLLLAYRDYVGISRYPWRLIAKNLCFLGALVSAWHFSKVTSSSYFRPRLESTLRR